MNRSLAIICITITTSVNLHAAGFEFAMATNVANARYGWRTVALEVYSGIVEKAECASIATNDWPAPPGWYGHRAKGIEYKDFMADELLPLYVNISLTNSAGQYYTSNNAVSFSMLTGETACTIAGISTNYLDVMGWYQWYDTNSWQHMADILNLCRWTRAAINPADRRVERVAVYPVATNVVDPGSQVYWLDFGAGGFDADCATALASQAVAWTDGPAVTNTAIPGTLGTDPQFGPPFHAVLAGSDTNTTSPFTFRAQRSAGWTWLDAIPTNVSHALDIYGRIDPPMGFPSTTNALDTAGNLPWAELNAGTNAGRAVFSPLDNPLHSATEFRILRAINSGSVATTNYRAMNAGLGYTEDLLLPLRDAQNPVTKAALACTNNADGVLLGTRVEWRNADFLMRHDANAASGMQYIFN